MTVNAKAAVQKKIVPRPIKLKYSAVAHGRITTSVNFSTQYELATTINNPVRTTV